MKRNALIDKHKIFILSIEHMVDQDVHTTISLSKQTSLYIVHQPY